MFGAGLPIVSPLQRTARSELPRVLGSPVADAMLIVVAGSLGQRLHQIGAQGRSTHRGPSVRKPTLLGRTSNWDPAVVMRYFFDLSSV